MASFASSATTGGARKHVWTKKRLNDGNNNGQATHGAHKHAWRTQAAWAKKTMVSFASSATTGGARKHAWTKNCFLNLV